MAVLQTLINSLRDFFSSQPVEKAWLFGSYARGEERPDSDVDILVTYTPGTRLGLFGICELTEKLEKLTGRSVDLVEQGSLYPRVAKDIESYKLLIYERGT